MKWAYTYWDVRNNNMKNIKHQVKSSFSLKCSPTTDKPDVNTLRLLTYNVHSCRCMDGRLSTHRIARVIAQYQPRYSGVTRVRRRYVPH